MAARVSCLSGTAEHVTKVAALNERIQGLLEEGDAARQREQQVMLLLMALVQPRRPSRL